MELATEFSQLLERYRHERQNPAITEGQFRILLLVFPAILVSQADGHIDTSEMIQLNKMTKHLAQKLKLAEEIDLHGEIRYLSWNARVWRGYFLTALRIFMVQNKLENEVVDLMLAAASSSTGNVINNILMRSANPNVDMSKSSVQPEGEVEFISAKEKAEINAIVDYMGLLEDEAISWKLAHVLQ
jgi:glycine betaine/choline ABC-type transport system substrate-binding protein